MRNRRDERDLSRADEALRLLETPQGGRAVRPFPAPAAGKGDGRPPSPEALVQAFNSWAFKREQPDDPEGLKRLAAAAIQSRTPLRFVLYWGRGGRNRVGPAERQCLDFLRALVRRVETLHAPGADVTIIFTDTHAELNGHARFNSSLYFGEVEREAAERGFQTCLLGDLVSAAEGRIDSVRANEQPSPDLLAALTVSAAKWHGGGLPEEHAARAYYRANMIEKQAVEAAFPDAVFVTFNGSAHRRLFPDGMPVFYMYSVRRGVAVKPWFMPAEPGRQNLEAVP